MRVGETIEQSGRRIGGHAWVAMRLFEALGRWSGVVEDARLRAVLATASRRFGWQAELWHRLLPAVPHLPSAALVAADADTAGLPAVLASLDAAPDGERAAVVADEVLPWLAERLEAHRAVTTPLADGPTVRVLELALAEVGRSRDALSTWVESHPSPSSWGAGAATPGGAEGRRGHP
ncbi:MAG TPA: hypothetical protein VFW63_07185 [Acidimicrobiales bacterium]|nr:hypothetical protein [Acidimicrobiales bacterium]